MKLFPDLSKSIKPLIKRLIFQFLKCLSIFSLKLSWPCEMLYPGGKKDIANYTSLKKSKHWGCIFLILYECTHIVRSDAFNVLSDILDDYIICKAT